jgi:hypothetical protein
VLGGKLEGRIETKGRRGGRRKQPLDYLKKKRRHWKLKQEAAERISLWKRLWTRRETNCGVNALLLLDYRRFAEASQLT